MANKWGDLLGSSLGKFGLGFLGPLLKKNATDSALDIRNAGDSAFVLIRALVLAATGDTIILNEQATSTGASWKFKVSRPSTGMTHDLEVILPSGDPAVGQAMTVASFTSNVITLQWSSVAGADKVSTDTTSLAFGSTSPVAMFTLPQNARVLEVRVIIVTPFSGGTGATVSVGITGTLSKFGPSTAWDLTGAAGTTYFYTPGQIADTGGTEALIATYSAGSATAGAALIEVDYVIPG